jgi:hypothetical protein
MFYDTSTWYLSVVPVALAILISFVANTKLSSTVKALGGKVRTRLDLQPIKEAINLNKLLAWIYIAVWLGQILLVILFAFNGQTTFKGAIGHVFVFGVVTLPFGLWSKSVEKRFKGMVIESNDPLVGQTWQRWLVEWRQASLAVKD